MTKKTFKVLSILVFLIAGICCYKTQQSGNNNASNTVAGSAETTPSPCPASVDWVNNPQTGPGEVPLGNQASICQFYQFSWQWFLAMMNQTQGGTNRNYQNQEQYPQLQASGSSCGPNSKPTFFVRTSKNRENKRGDFVLPEDPNQALNGAVIFDQSGDVVLYETRFSRNECTYAQISPTPTPPQNFPAGTIEMKVSYRQITQADVANYVTINVDINRDGKIDPTELLGMVGFHLVISTPDHPEFIWATFEHKQNAPECQKQADPSQKWSFTSSQCAAQLPNSVNQGQCSFNTAPTPAASPTPVPLTGGTPTQICRVYHDGSAPGDNQYSTNIFDIDTLNDQLTGLKGIITTISPQSPFAVLKNYEMVGALWVTQDTTSPSFPNGSTVLANQRGSIQLANTTMETTAQQGFSSPPYTGTSNLQPAASCFACHAFDPTAGNVAQSHIFDDILGQPAK